MSINANARELKKYIEDNSVGELLREIATACADIAARIEDKSPEDLMLAEWDGVIEELNEPADSINI